LSQSGLTGSRIRARRIDLHVRQARLAEICGISPSYLNLIEHNRRRIGGKLLVDIAAALKTEPSILSAGADETLISALSEAAIAWPDAQAETGRVEEFAGRFPGWSRTLARQVAHIAELEQSIEALNDRLAHDPQLAASLHDILSSVTGIRSASAILVDDQQVDPAWEARFHRNIHEDSRRLAAAAEGLVSYLEADRDRDHRPISPQEEFETWLAGQGYHVPALEDPAADVPKVLAAMAGDLSAEARAQAVRHLTRYQADAARLPLPHLCDLLAAHGLDPEVLSSVTQAPLSVLLRRLASLPEALLGADLGLAVSDPSGTLTFFRPLDGFALPRYGAACPLLPVFSALTRPIVPVAALIEQAGRSPQRFQTFAVAEPTGPVQFGGATPMEATMLVLRDERGGEDETRPPIETGLTCRVCPRAACPARREPSMLNEEE
jgi:predicted transcriptional regulator/DNA-binding XRE family transcriptional regulator